MMIRHHVKQGIGDTDKFLTSFLRHGDMPEVSDFYLCYGPIGSVGLAVAEGIDRGAAVPVQPKGGPYSPGGPPLFAVLKTTSVLKPVNCFHALHLRH